jgi:hypothetical protein
MTVHTWAAGAACFSMALLTACGGGDDAGTDVRSVSSLRLIGSDRHPEAASPAPP